MPSTRPFRNVCVFLLCMTRVSSLAQAEPVEHGERVPATRGALTGRAAQAEDEPSEEVRASYREVVARAVAEFEAGHFAEARALFLRAHELWPSARTFRTLGMTAFDMRMYVRALDERRRPLTAEQRAQVEALLEQTRGFVGRYRVQGVPRDATLWVDGELRPLKGAPLVLAVGEHVLTVRAPGHTELRRVLVVQGRDDETVELHLEPDAAPAREREAQTTRGGLHRLALPLTALGVGMAGFVTSGVRC